jgi:hypothetical protein
LELLNAQNLIIHFDNKSKDKATTLVSTLLSRMLKATEGQLLNISVIDPKLGMGLNNYFKTGLPSNIYKVLKVIDPSDLLEQERRVLQMTGGGSVEHYNQSKHAGDNLLDYQIVVFQDWYSTLNERIIEDDFLSVVNNSIHAGYCFIFMVNDDNKPDETALRRRDEDDILMQLSHCLVIDLKEQWINDSQQLELMNNNQVFEVLKDVRNAVTPHPKDIDVGVLLEEKKVWGAASSRNGFSLFIGKNNSLQDLELHFEDNIIQQSLLVNYIDDYSNVFPWVNALVAQAFTLFSPEELNVLVADFTGNKEIAALSENRTILEPPYYYVGWNANKKEHAAKDSIGFQLPDLFTSFLSNCQEKRLLAFIIGSYDDLKKYVISKNFLKKKRIHFVFLTTDYVIDDTRRQTSFEGYQLSFGPRRIENQMSRYRGNEKTQTLSGDEFMFEGDICYAYTYSIEKTKQIIGVLSKKTVVATNENHEPPKNIPEEEKPLETALKPQATQENLTITPAVGNLKTTPFSNPERKANANTRDVLRGISDDNGDEERKFGYQKTYTFQSLPKENWWKGNCATSFEVPFGIHIDWNTGKTQEWSFQFDDDGTKKNAAFVLGGQGAGKSSVLNTLIIGAAQRYSPKELEFYLFDFKNVGFLPYELFNLPHARVVASGDDRDFTISVLQDLEKELERRKTARENETFPRTIVIVDECHHLFRLNDPVSKLAIGLFESIIREGRALGMNVIFSTQMLSSPTTDFPADLFDLVGTRIVSNPEKDYRRVFPERDMSEATTLGSYCNGEMMFAPKGKPTDLPLEDYHAKSYYIQYDSKKPNNNSELKTIIEELASFARSHPDQCPKSIVPFKYHYNSDLVQFVARERMREEHRKPVSDLPQEIPMYLGTPIANAKDVYLTLVPEEFHNVLVIGLSDAPVGQGIAYQALSSSLMAYPVEGNDNHVAKRVDYVFNFNKNSDPFSKKLIKEVTVSPFSPQSEVIPNLNGRVVETLTKIKALIEDRMNRPLDEIDSHVFVSLFGLNLGHMFGEENVYSNKEATDLLCHILSNGPACGVFTIVQYCGRKAGLQAKIGNNIDVFNHIIALQTEENLSGFPVPLSGLYPSMAKKNPALYRAIYYDRREPECYQKFKPYKF